LERWRWAKKGPPFLKLGGRIVYELAEIEAFEKTRRRMPEAALPTDRVTP
jgi:hypothetical protein